jgi:prepilin-type N-terminal cleavage/methylation domain-containing protein
MHSKKGFTLIELMIVVAIIGILAAIAIPQYIKYIKRSRTGNGVDHARMICMALTDWYSAPNMADGDATFAVPPVTTLGKDNIPFYAAPPAQSHFPSEGDWILNGDAYYNFAVNMANPSDPVITATSRNGPGDPAVYGDTVQAGGTSIVLTVPSNSLSGCKTNVELVSTAY